LKRVNYIYILLTGLCLASGAAALIHKYDVQQISAAEAKRDIDVLAEQSIRLAAIAGIDSMRSAHIRKSMAIIERFNPDLPQQTRYAIGLEISEACMKYDNLDVDLLCATITHESAFTWDPKVVSPAGAMGLMQIMPRTAKFLARIEGLEYDEISDILFNPVLNIRLGSRYLASLIDLYDVDGGLAAYNGGGIRAARWLALNKRKGVLFKETQHYVPAVLALYDEFRN
jgi:soluble lytic murein transglycosylase-like protein